MKKCFRISVAILIAPVGSACSVFDGMRGANEAQITGIARSCPGPFVNLEEVSINQAGVPGKLVLKNGDIYQTKQPTVFEIAASSEEGSYTYSLLLSGGAGTEAEAVTKLHTSLPYAEMVSGWALFWGTRPRGGMRLVSVIAVATEMILKNQTTPNAAEYVFLLSGGPLHISCNKTGRRLATLTSPNTYLRVTDAGGGDCDIGSGVATIAVGSPEESFVSDATACKAAAP